MNNKTSIFLLMALLVMSGCGAVDDPSLFPAFAGADAADLEPLRPTTTNGERNLYFGDLHIHTSLSTDAYVMGVRSMPDDVYRFAKGQTLEHAAGYPIRIDRPLDFAAVTDHSEYLGQAAARRIDVPTTRTPLREILLEGNLFSITWAWLRSTLAIRSQGFAVGMDALDNEINRAAWLETIAAAQRHYEPQRFTSFIGYEWSASVGDIATHIHRNVIYRTEQVSALPFSSMDSSRPEDLWDFLADEESQGRVAIAIPHNANVSRGNMYKRVDSDGEPIDDAYARRRNHFEPVSEILQIKGASETHPLLSPLDEFADYGIARMQPGEKTSYESVAGSYARQAMRDGLVLGYKNGVNPFQFGVIGASDSHNASSPSQESSYHGKLPMMDGSAALRTNHALALPESANPVTSWSSGGLAGVWAEENTREALFEALRRRETYATSGPRMTLRMFGGWDYSPTLTEEQGWVKKAYQSGVPMGGVLTAIEEPLAPAFIVVAMKDPLGANLDRVQIVKGWIDADGRSHETVIDVAPGDRRDSHDASLSAVGNTVDIKTATYDNSIGSTSLTAYWRDPQFDPAQPAFYYARVLEIPTPRWSTYDAVRLGIPAMEPAVIQERAIGSAIWYRP